MPKYRIVIEEQVAEYRTYEVEAVNPKAAAQMARELWIDNGEEPIETYTEVEERDYTVTGQGTEVVFNECEMEEDDE